MDYGAPLGIYLHVAAADDSVTEKRRESQTGKSTTANHSPTSLNTEPFSSATLLTQCTLQPGKAAPNSSKMSQPSESSSPPLPLNTISTKDCRYLRGYEKTEYR